MKQRRGQGAVELALLTPLLLLITIGLLEFGFVWNSRNTVLFASRDGSMLAAEAGSATGADCVILNRIERDIVSPASSIKIQNVRIYWSDRNGVQIGANANVYSRSGSTTCNYSDGSHLTVPYSLTTGGYLEPSRCIVMAGCGGAHSGLDTMGVTVTYQHNWLTPVFRNAVGLGVIFSETSLTRGEPQL